MKKTVFLGGTCNGSLWREELIPQLTNADAYNPVVADWTPECQAEEIRQRESSDICLYVITPKMTGVYSIAEAVDDANKRPDRTVFAFIEKDGDAEFNAHQLKSLLQTGKLIEGNGATFIRTTEELVAFLNR